jgi:cyclopropane fatty-acyl-phospholipid synthase-like methyltransferase
MKLGEFYNESFYAQHIEGMSTSATTVLQHLFRYHPSKSMLDVGCGQGAWLAAAEALGVESLKGFDGEWVKPEQLQSKNIDFEAVNFDAAIPSVDQRFDLCISLEVAEHVSRSKAKDFVDLLCSASDVILFSAAIPHQGGTNHVNEEWQSYWVEIFAANGYRCEDFIRGLIWDDDAVEWWYKQNILVFYNTSNQDACEKFQNVERKPMLDAVHPQMFERKMNAFTRKTTYPSLGFCFGSLKRFFINTIPSKLGKR